MKGDMKERLNLLISCGHPIFVLDRTVCWPVEAEDFLTDEEMTQLEGYILSNV